MATEFRLASRGSKPNPSVFLGLLAGISNSTGVSVSLLRAIFIVGILFAGASPGIYLLAWLVAAILFGYDGDED